MAPVGNTYVLQRYTHDRYSVELKSISELCYVFAVVSIVRNSDSLFVNLVLARPCNSSPVHDRVSYHESIFERPTLVRNSNFGVCTTGHGCTATSVWKWLR